MKTAVIPFCHAQGLRIVDLYAKKGVDTSRLYIKVGFDADKIMCFGLPRHGNTGDVVCQ